MSSKDLQAVVKTHKAFIKELLDRLAQREEDRCLNLIADGFSMNINGGAYPLKQIKNLLNDDYFKGLTLEQILELAKKSIRLTDDNCKMRHKLENIREILIEKDLCVNKDCDSCCNKYSNKIKEILDK